MKDEKENLNELMENNRADEMKAIMRFIDTCHIDELARIVEEIRCCHDCLFAFNEETGLLAKIESICINGEAIQMNIENECE
jgi:hypothetical protein